MPNNASDPTLVNLSNHAVSIKSALPEEILSQWQNLLNSISELFDVPSVLLNQSNEVGIEVLAANEHTENPYSAGGIVPLDCNIYCHQVVRENHALHVPNAELETIWDDNPEYTQDGLLSYLGVPLNWPDGRVFGTLCVMDRKPLGYDEKMLALLGHFKTLLEQQLALHLKNQQLNQLSMLDDMTQLYNRRGLLEAVKQQIAMAQRTESYVCVVYIDVDCLKPVNDQHGHEAGDRLICQAADTIKTVMRTQDIAARLGGDEFAWIAIVEDPEDEARLLTRIGAAATHCPVELADGVRQNLSISTGASIGQPTSIEAFKDLLEQADKQMYACKQGKKADA